ncbi:MAG: hypothetical protein ACYDIB_01905 [Desulfobulbia bacterium]
MKMLLAWVVALCSFLVFSTAYAFDFNQYKQGDIDTILQMPRPKAGVDIYGPQKLRFRVTLAGYGQPCETGFLKKTMKMVGVPADVVENLPISQCITVKTSKRVPVSLFIQDQVAEYLPKEVKIGQQVDLFCDFLFVGTTSVGILVNEFQ